MSEPRPAHDRLAALAANRIYAHSRHPSRARIEAVLRELIAHVEARALIEIACDSVVLDAIGGEETGKLLVYATRALRAKPVSPDIFT